MAGEPMLIVIQTPIARHIENRVYPAGVLESINLGFHRALCEQAWRYSDLEAEGGKRVRVEAFPPAAICPDCIRRARLWYASSLFETFDVVQCRRLLANLGRDLAAVN